MQKREGNKRLKLIASSEISIMILAIFAFAFVLNESEIATGQEQISLAAAAERSSPLYKAPPVTQTPTGGGGSTFRFQKAPDIVSIGEKAGAAGTYNKGIAGDLLGIKGPVELGWGSAGLSLINGLMWAAAAYGIAQMIGSLAGLEAKQTQALGQSLATAAFMMQISQGIPVTATQSVAGWVGGLFGATGETASLIGGGIIGLVAGAIIFIATYKKEGEKTTTFNCVAWEAPTGGAKCEECNKDPFRPCTEYRCKSLGQACQLLNKDMPGKEKCSWVSRNDAKSPTITPWKEAFRPTDQNLKFVTDTSARPPALGVKIVREGNNPCLQAYTKLEFGLTTDEPAQCKVDIAHTKNISAMTYYFGDTAAYDYNHTQIMRLPGPNITEEQTSPLFTNDGTMSMFVRCMDGNGNSNDDEYKISFCVDKGPDTTAPRIESTSITSGNPVRFGADKVHLEVYVNEPAECKWSMESKPFDNMENTMNCATSPGEINALMTYTCSGNMTGIKNDAENKYYFRCKDQPDKPDNVRNVMVQSYEFVLKGSKELNIMSTGPNETISGSTETVAVDLEVETDDGAEEGKAYCFFSPSGLKDTYTEMFETNNYKHKQTLYLTTGNYKYYFRCIDLGGNTDEGITGFSVFVDKSAPIVTRVYKEEATGLRVATNEDAECAYSQTNCNFVFDEGTKMTYFNPSVKDLNFVEWKPNMRHYIKCRDMYGNEPSPNECSVIVKSV